MKRSIVLIWLLFVPLASWSQGIFEKMQQDIENLKARVSALEKPVEPPKPEPPKPPIPDPRPGAGEWTLQLLGGWKVPGEFSRGGIAIDHTSRKLFMVGHGQRNEVYEYDLPVHGTGDLQAWPMLKRIQLIQGWWPASHGYANSLAWHDGKLWAAPRLFYDMNPPATTSIFARSGDMKTINIPRQSYSGFVKSPGTEFPFIGGGGYESGQGSAFGPSLAKPDGTIQIRRSFASTWENRERRQPNYTALLENGRDGWTALTPKDVDGDGTVDGCWACDRIYAGGIRHPSGIYFWPWMGTGVIDYKLQNETFCTSNQTYQYRYDPVTFKLLSYKPFPVPDRVLGQEISPDGKYLYLMIGNQWISGLYKVDPVLQIYEIK